LKLTNRHGNIFPSDHLAGVGENDNDGVQDDESDDSESSDSEDSEDSSEGSTDSEDSEDADAEEIEEEIEDENDFEPDDRNALYDVIADDRQLGRVSEVAEADDDDDVPDLRERDDDGSDDDEPPAPRRSTRTRRIPQRYCAATIKIKARDPKVKRPTLESYVEDQASWMTMKGRVLFEHDDEYEMETKYNLHGSATKDNTLEYEGDEAYVIARMISEINLRATVDGKNFAQQYMLKKGLEKFGNKG